MRISILSDNRAEKGFSQEHGFSCIVERDGGKSVVFDTGASGLFLSNAHRLGIEPVRAAACVISHGHYDHTGGVKELIREGFKGPVFSGPEFFAPRWAAEAPRWKRLDAGFLPGDIAANGHVLIPEGRAHEVLPGVFALTGFASPYPEEAPNPRYRIGPENAGPVDRFEGEACVVIDRGSRGFLMIVGCAHPGIAGMAARIKDMLGAAPRRIIGGFHLSTASGERVTKTLERLKALGVEALGPCHCSGDAISSAVINAGFTFIDIKAGRAIDLR